MVMDEAEKSTARWSYNNIPKHIRMEAGKYTLPHSTKVALLSVQNNIQSIRSNERP